MITIDDFKKLEIRIGHILSAEKVPDTDKLLKLSVDFGLETIPVSTTPSIGMSTPPILGGVEKRDIRQIVSGIAIHFPDPKTLVGKKCAFAANLEPRIIRGLESNGMILAVSTEDGKFSLLESSADIPAGTRVK